MLCPRCSMDKEEFKKGMCVDCKRAENNAVSYQRRHNNWVELAEESGLELFERQPGETDGEFAVWMCYRDMYPSAKPNLREVAEKLGKTHGAVREVSRVWKFATRMQAWVKHIDSASVAQKRQEILEMNKQHMDMAATLNEKLARAIANIDPMTLSPKEINAFMKTASELEKKARVDQYNLEVSGNPNGQMQDDNPELKKATVKSGDINEILQILSGTGMLHNAGVRQTVTTEVVVKGDE